MPSKPRITLDPATKGYLRRHYFRWVRNGVVQHVNGLAITAKSRAPDGTTYLSPTVTIVDTGLEDANKGLFYVEHSSGQMNQVSGDTEATKWWLDVYIESEPVPFYCKFDCYAKETEA